MLAAMFRRFIRSSQEEINFQQPITGTAICSNRVGGELNLIRRDDNGVSTIFAPAVKLTPIQRYTRARPLTLLKTQVSNIVD